MRNPVTAVAYERKDELGGGFRARVLDRRDKQVHESDVLPTIEAARYWARQKIEKLMMGQPWAPGYTYKPWTLNVWVR